MRAIAAPAILDCSVFGAVETIGDAWSWLVLSEAIIDGISRFDEFQHRLNIATNILAGRLRRLVERQILTRTAYQHRPARHEYRLTEKGLDLYPVPLSMLAWADRWLANGRPPVRLTHTSCGHRLRPILTCSCCRKPISLSDITFEPIIARKP